jgi:hypothetical protein
VVPPAPATNFVWESEVLGALDLHTPLYVMFLTLSDLSLP